MDRIYELGQKILNEIITPSEGTEYVELVIDKFLDQSIVDAGTIYFENDNNTHMDFDVVDSHLKLFEPRIEYCDDDYSEVGIMDIPIDDNFDTMVAKHEEKIIMHILKSLNDEAKKYERVADETGSETCKAIAQHYRKTIQKVLGCLK